jgi:hypothetical protein
MRFKVEFENNVAVKATRLGTSLNALSVDFGETAGSTIISSLVIEAETEGEAVDAANEMAAHIWSELLVGM